MRVIFALLVGSWMVSVTACGGDGALGETCSSNGDCATGMCWQHDDELLGEVAFCSESCDGMSAGAACGDNGACLMEGGDDNICIPKCNATTDCSVNAVFTECQVLPDSGGEQICTFR